MTPDTPKGPSGNGKVRMLKAGLRFSFALLRTPYPVLALLLLGLLAVGRRTREEIRTWDRYTIAFGAIECTPPPGQSRAEFLQEVQYLAELPDRLRILDEDLAARLTRAFGRHPSVEKVHRVIKSYGPQVHVQLALRIPVLVVPLDGQNRAVDRQAILLPPSAPAEGLPVLRSRVGPPPGPAGDPWEDDTLTAAALTAGFLHAYQDRLHLTECHLLDGDLVWNTRAGTRIFWGRPPGLEAAGEALAADKLKRLLRYCAEHRDLDHPRGIYGHDLRFASRSKE